jgi:hypothetical protein
MERLKHLKDTIMCCVEGAVANIGQADTQELGDAIDMLKDLEEAIYYATITKAMHANEEKGKEREVMYYPYPMYYNGGKEDYYNAPRDMDRYMGKMYYNEGGGNGGGNGNGNGSGTRMYQEPKNTSWQDAWEGRAPRSRRSYMEAKHNRHGKEAQMKELESYMQELTADIAEMIQDSSPEEKQLMQKKIAALAEKVGKINV